MFFTTPSIIINHATPEATVIVRSEWG
jgi:hypothetical protein